MRRAIARVLLACCAALLLVVTSGGAARAAESRVAQPTLRSSQAPTLHVLTFGPGDATFSKFGHDAIWVHDPRQPPQWRDLVFNYGTFRFDSPWLILDFLQGKLQYWLSASSLERTLAAYRAANRSVVAQELDLTPREARAITAFLHENLAPENAYYRYDYYRDNCATRIRDLIDRHLGHRLSAASRGPAPLTYRQHTQRLTVDSPFLFFGLDLAMGPLIDRPLTEWEAMFLPARVEAKLAELTTARGAPLVRHRQVLFEARRAPPPEDAPGFRWGWLGAGLAVGVGLYGLGRARQRWGQISLAVAVGAIGALVGVLGTLLLILWGLTDHDVTYWNQNLLLCPPWALGIPILAVDFARTQPRRRSLMMRMAVVGVLGALLVLVLRVLLPSGQDTTTPLAFFLPVWVGLGLAVWERCGRPLPRSAAASGRFARISRQATAGEMVPNQAAAEQEPATPEA